MANKKRKTMKNNNGLNTKKTQKERNEKRKSQEFTQKVKQNGGNNINHTLKRKHMPLNVQLRLLRNQLKPEKKDVQKKKTHNQYNNHA